MFFTSDYGETKLKHDLFPGSPVVEFDQLILRAGSTDTFPCVEWAAVGLGPGGSLYQRWARAWASYIRDQWVRIPSLPWASRGRGGVTAISTSTEPTGGFITFASILTKNLRPHISKEQAEWDSLVDFSELQAGTTAAWSQLTSLAGASATDATFQQMQGRNPGDSESSFSGAA